MGRYSERVVSYCDACFTNGNIEGGSIDEIDRDMERPELLSLSPVQLSDDDLDDDDYLNLMTDDETYIGEYENEDPHEDNSEKMIEIKDLVKDLGEIVFDNQERIPEGEYLKLMDYLQRITNIANR